MTLANPATHTTALVAKLTTAGIVAFDEANPTARHGWQGTPGHSTFTAYAVVYALSQVMDGSLGAPDDDSEFAWQVTCVAGTRVACDELVHAVNVALVGQSLTVSGRTVPRIRNTGDGAATRREADEAPSLAHHYVAMPRFAAFSN